MKGRAVSLRQLRNSLRGIFVIRSLAFWLVGARLLMSINFS